MPSESDGVGGATPAPNQPVESGNGARNRNRRNNRRPQGQNNNNRAPWRFTAWFERQEPSLKGHIHDFTSETSPD